MIRVVCDQCDKAIGRVFGDWFGVDHAKLDDDGELIQPEDEYQLHFCSWDCLQRYAFAQAFTLDTPQPEGTTPHET